MAKKNNSSKNITIANIVSIVGLVLLLVFTFIGHSYMSIGELGLDFLVSAGITALAAFLLWFMVKAKGSFDPARKRKWKYVEIATLAAYIIFAVPASLFGGIMHFFVVNGNKEELKQYANKDLDKIRNLFEVYEDFEGAAYGATKSGLENILKPNQECDESLNKFMEENKIEHTDRAVKNFLNRQYKRLLGDGYKDKKQWYLDKISDMESSINSWNMITIPMKAKYMEKVATQVEEELTERSDSAKLPNISRESTYITITKQNQNREYKVEGGVESFQFMNALRQAEGFSPMAIIVVLLIHLMVLFNYIVAYRPYIIYKNEMEEDGGRIL